jgi:hypothetical protein
LGISGFMTCFFQQLLQITCQWTLLNLVPSVLRHVNLFITFLRKLLLDILLNIIIIIIITSSSPSPVSHSSVICSSHFTTSWLLPSVSKYPLQQGSSTEQTVETSCINPVAKASPVYVVLY